MSLRLMNFPFLSFFLKKFNPNSNIFKITKVFFVAFLLSNSIYLSFFENIVFETLSPFLAIWGLVLLLRSKSAKEYFWIGFFVGIFWFWWVGLSSIYFNLNYLVPLIIVFMGIFYGILFRICHLFKFDFLRLCAIFCLSFIHPLGFDWLNWGIFSVYGFFDADTRGTICIFLIAYFYYEKYISRYYKMAIILTLFFIGFHYEQKNSADLNLNYELLNTNISQDQKYVMENIQNHSNALIKEIINAIKEQKKLIVLPESAFAFDLENDFNAEYQKILKQLSHKIIIITGAFSTKENQIYNSTYIFNQGEVYILNKHFLVPFGEEIPFFKSLVKKYFLPNIGEFSKGTVQSKYTLNGQSITNAICYEATKERIYKDSELIIALSNNAWFNHSSEYKLQQLLMKFYANKYGVSIYHSVNGKENAIIKPKELLYKKWEVKFEKFYQKIKNIIKAATE
ncbi:MAG: apolipoprotein N-acyltransferase [Campylobacter sp.]|nr:apolipoprotein N-acyltransferase [Campylobacter sp.]